MKELSGVWWTINQKQVPGRLIITDENKILLTTYEKLYETGIINGFAGCEKITLVNATLDRTDAYYKPEEKEEFNGITIETNEEVKYYTYTYIAEMVILGHDYKRRGDIRLRSLQLKYTNLEKWVDWKTETPIIKETKENIVVKFKTFPGKRVKLDKFDIVIRKPYAIIEEEYDMHIHNETTIFVENIGNAYIEALQEIITCIQYFLVLCMGDNINVTQIKAIDIHNNNIELILGHGKSNYENRSILKNIIKYDDIKDNLETILKNWIKLYVNDELLIANFVNLQRIEAPLITEYKDLTSAIDSLYLVITKQNNTKEHFAEMVKRLIKETNFILNLSEEEINDIAIKVKDIRRYFVHSNKTQKNMVNSNISYITNIMNFLIEVIRARIMLEIGVDKKPLEEYYKTVKQLQNMKFDIINNINDDDREDERVKEGKKVMRPLSKNEKEDIAKLNSIMGTRYREDGYDLENSEDLIEAIVNVTAEYMDYMHYWGQIASVLEDFDQSLEVYYPEKWFKKANDGTTGNPLIDRTVKGLAKLYDDMYEIAAEAEVRCKEIWEFLLKSNDQKAKEHFLGDVSKYTQEELLEALDETIENVCEVEYQNQIETDAQSFADDVKFYLEN